jgi:hypothetical protein
VDPKVGLDDVEKRKFLHCQDSNSDPSVFQPVASRYTAYAIPAHYEECSYKSINLFVYLIINLCTVTIGILMFIEIIIKMRF